MRIYLGTGQRKWIPRRLVVIAAPKERWFATGQRHVLPVIGTINSVDRSIAYLSLIFREHNLPRARDAMHSRCRKRYATISLVPSPSHAPLVTFSPFFPLSLSIRTSEIPSPNPALAERPRRRPLFLLGFFPFFFLRAASFLVSIPRPAYRALAVQFARYA